VSGAGEIAGGAMIQWKPATRAGSAVLLVAYALYCVLYVPAIIAAPLTFAPWGNLFEPLAMIAAGIILFARPHAVLQAGLLLFTICVITFGVYQAVNPVYTAGLVPKWILPGQMFWMWLTTAAFLLAAVALIVRRFDVLAARLLTLMLLVFQAVLWIPAVVAQQHSAGMWEENVLNFAIAASCWVVADFLAARA
jgi:hypothetical protein